MHISLPGGVTPRDIDQAQGDKEHTGNTFRLDIRIQFIPFDSCLQIDGILNLKSPMLAFLETITGTSY